jgi:hypothetical protein
MATRVRSIIERASAHASAVLISLSAFGCSSGNAPSGNSLPSAPKAVPDNGDVPPNVEEALRKAAAIKAHALNNATVQVHRAYHYAGATAFKPTDNTKLISVDVGIAGNTDAFKLWDIDIIDAQTNENFGSDPELAFLNREGGFLSYDADTIDFTRPLRLLLIYTVPKKTSAIKLGYWGKDLNTQAIPLQLDGMILPPKK